MYGLIDINSCYCACEQAFRPDLAGKPVVVLSNNDASCIARNKQAKALGIKMGEPFFKIKDLIERNNVAVFSSNYALYSAFSSRFASVIESLTPRSSVYSIDELWFEATNITGLMTLDAYGRMLREEVQRQTTLTCGVGIAPTKTLAKLCSHASKTYPATGGVVALDDVTRLEKLMRLVPVEDVWGVGPRLGKRLRFMGVETAFQLSCLDPVRVRKQFNVVLERTVRELRGEPCMALEENDVMKQQIVVSRSFGERVTNLLEMQQAITDYAARAAEKLRQEKGYASVIGVFIRTSPYAVNDVPYSNQATEMLVTPSNDSRDIINAAQRALKRIWRPEVRYAKAGVMLCDIREREPQLDLFTEPAQYRNSENLMQLLDTLNKQGRHNLFFAGQGINPVFAMKRNMLSPAYLTSWDDLPKVRLG
ncbi:translesion error-prone DNA polymerase V subunit UmuC [Providencia rettgeri]|uniref:Translesion error-prone DNA polymerase V subunit UmuC n=1 Tax=Providencia rettgeri TaxID=587 RepID=A0AAW6UNF1_PRORE|nr:translesion error-prone DNA polymerase V subunit UmuC [Providencia rettgeri]MDI9095144.1 translesion error-prone DNA polymerase V subunit UmuC [Providencia rettgeri]